MSLKSEITENIGVPPVDLRDVRIGGGVRSSLIEVIDGLPASGTVAVLTDASVYRTATDDDVKGTILDALRASRAVVHVVLPGEVHADEVTVEAAVAGCHEADVVVTIGSGTLCDIGKVAAGNRPHIVVQSAASVNGFADDQSVLLINGVKRTTHSGWPHTLLIDNEILAGAPATLNRSGLGDMISMFTAPADWYLAAQFQMDRGFRKNFAVMTRRYGDSLLDIASGVGSSEPESLTTLAEFVTLSGISMGAAGQTSPSSGMEHTVSHLIDMANGSNGASNALHGEQVGVATVLVSLLWRRMAARLADRSIGALAVPDAEFAEAAVRKAFTWMDENGATADECWRDYSAKRSHLESVDAAGLRATLVNTWPTHAAELDEMLVAPERIVAALTAAGAPTRFRDLSQPIDRDTVVWAMTNCHLMRNRFTIADLAYLTGHWSDSDVEAVIAEADALGAGL